MNIINELMGKYEINIFDNIIHIVKYKKIIDISSNSISIDLDDFNVKIVGKELIISKLNMYELSIKGNIKGLFFEK